MSVSLWNIHTKGWEIEIKMFPIKTAFCISERWFIESLELSLQHSSDVFVSFSWPSGDKLNVAEITFTSKGGISRAGTSRVQRKISCWLQQSSNQCWDIAQRWIPERIENISGKNSLTKTLLHNVCYHNLHYSINWDLGGLLIKMSVPRRQNLAMTSLNLN